MFHFSHDSLSLLPLPITIGIIGRGSVVFDSEIPTLVFNINARFEAPRIKKYYFGNMSVCVSQCASVSVCLCVCVYGENCMKTTFCFGVRYFSQESRNMVIFLLENRS